MHPRARCARAEAGELPRYTGMGSHRRFELTKMASSRRSKSAGGREPVKSLNQRSRYLSEGRESTTSGNIPTRRLLLRSSSWRRCRRRKVDGATPQKWLELRRSGLREGQRAQGHDGHSSTMVTAL
jgi:hypothetical protein